MKTKLVVTIDVEEDWETGNSPTTKNIKAIPKLQKICDICKIRPTYLINYPVLEDKKNIEIFKKILRQKKCEIGTHLHPWNTPPFNEKDSKFRFPHELSNKELTKKFNTITKKIKTAFNITPTSYRAGRYGIDGRQIKLLEKHNYLVDSSTTPLWHTSLHRINPYFADYENVYKKGDSKILEIPITILFNKKFNINKNIYYNLPNRVKGILSRTNLLRLCWLRPSYTSLRDMRKIINIAIKKKMPIINMMFHSNELTQGTSPYTKTKFQTNLFYNRLIGIRRYTRKKGIKSITLSEARGIIK